MLDLAEQEGQQGPVDDLDPNSTAGACGQQGEAAVELGCLFVVLGVDRLLDNLFRDLMLGRDARHTEQTQRVIGAGCPRRPPTLSRLRGLPLGLLPFATVLSH